MENEEYLEKTKQNDKIFLEGTQCTNLDMEYRRVKAMEIIAENLIKLDSKLGTSNSIARLRI